MQLAMSDAAYSLWVGGGYLFAVALIITVVSVFFGQDHGPE